MNRVVATGGDISLLQNETLKLARRIAQHSSYATARGKELFHQQLKMDYEEALQYATNRIVEDVCHSEDAATGIHNFCHKQTNAGPTKWKGR